MRNLLKNNNSIIAKRILSDNHPKGFIVGFSTEREFLILFGFKPKMDKKYKNTEFKWIVSWNFEEKKLGYEIVGFFDYEPKNPIDIEVSDLTGISKWSEIKKKKNRKNRKNNNPSYLGLTHDKKRMKTLKKKGVLEDAIDKAVFEEKERAKKKSQKKIAEEKIIYHGNREYNYKINSKKYRECRTIFDISIDINEIILRKTQFICWARCMGGLYWSTVATLLEDTGEYCPEKAQERAEFLFTNKANRVSPLQDLNVPELINEDGLIWRSQSGKITRIRMKNYRFLVESNEDSTTLKYAEICRDFEEEFVTALWSSDMSFLLDVVNSRTTLEYALRNRAKTWRFAPRKIDRALTPKKGKVFLPEYSSRVIQEMDCTEEYIEEKIIPIIGDELFSVNELKELSSSTLIRNRELVDNGIIDFVPLKKMWRKLYKISSYVHEYMYKKLYNSEEYSEVDFLRKWGFINPHKNHNMVKVPGGTFMMGVSESYISEGPIHKVTVSDFYMSEKQITQGFYLWVMGNNPTPIEKVGAYLPVVSVSWNDAIKFCNELSKKMDLEPCYDTDKDKCNFEKNGYRLPTEAEWEYSALNFRKSYTNFGDKVRLIDTAKDENILWEWCWDEDGRYSAEDEIDPTGPRRPRLGWKRISRQMRDWEPFMKFRLPRDTDIVEPDMGVRVVRREKINK